MSNLKENKTTADILMLSGMGLYLKILSESDTLYIE